MKILLSILSTVSFASGTTGKLKPKNIKYQENIRDNAVYIWNDVEISHQKSVGPTGTDAQSDVVTKLLETSGDIWRDKISNINSVKLEGYFGLLTHKEPSASNHEYLDLKEKSSSSKTFEIIRPWNKWAGWGHQTCEIKLTMNIHYYANLDTTNFELVSYIYARTASSVNKCTTQSIVNTAEFIV